MERIVEQCEHKQSEEKLVECNPEKEREEKGDSEQYDYHKRLWF
jgi:hypothetical protein